MIQTVQGFVEASAFERSALASVYSLVTSRCERGGLDLRSNRGSIAALSANDLAEEARIELIQKLRPLLFGAAWKVLDLLVEYGLNKKSLIEKKQPKAHWDIKEKTKKVSGAVVVPLSDDAGVWSRVSALYKNTVEIRHCLVHRRFVVFADGTMSHFVDKEGTPLALPPLIADEQNAFCRIAQRTFIIVKSSCFTPRDRLDIVGWLDQMTNHHGLGVIGGGAPERVPELIRVNAQQEPSGWVVDIATAQARAKQHYPDRPYFDVEIYFPDTGLPPLRGRLEHAPRDSPVPIDPANPPAWIDF